MKEASHIAVEAADPYAAIVAALDRAFMAFYGQARKNARRIARLAVTLVPLMMLLVGSCKTAQVPASYGSNAGTDQFRVALFPDRVNFTGVSYYPAEGYIARARKFVAGTPDTLTMLTEQEISYIFGKPVMERKDAEATVWQYKTESCVVDFYFYDQQGLEAESRVAYVDVRRLDGGKMRFKSPSETIKSDCFETVMDEGDFSSARI